MCVGGGEVPLKMCSKFGVIFAFRIHELRISVLHALRLLARLSIIAVVAYKLQARVKNDTNTTVQVDHVWIIGTCSSSSKLYCILYITFILVIHSVSTHRNTN